MNETGYLRQQLALERAHLLEIIQALHQGSDAVRRSRPVTDYIDWAGGRLVRQLQALGQALPAAATGADLHARLARLTSATAVVADGGNGGLSDLRAERLLALLGAWSEPLETLAGRTLHLTQWRRAAQLSADTILQERQLYTAARAAAGRS
jgi:hypothetical protein